MTQSLSHKMNPSPFLWDSTAQATLAQRALLLFIKEEKSRENLSRLSEFLKSETRSDTMLPNPMKRRLESILDEQLQTAFSMKSLHNALGKNKRLKVGPQDPVDEITFLNSFCPLYRSPSTGDAPPRRPLFSHKLFSSGISTGNHLADLEEDSTKISTDESEDQTTTRKSEKNKAKNVYKILGYRIVTDICAEKIHWQYQTLWKQLLTEKLSQEGVPAELFRKWVDETWLTFIYANGEMEKRCNLRCKKDFILMLEMSEKLKKELTRKQEGQSENLRERIQYCETFKKVALMWLERVAESFLTEKTNRLSPGTGALYLQKIPDIIQLFRKYDL